MPSTPYAKLLVSIDGGAPQSGGIEDVPPEASCQLSYESTIGWPSSPAPYVEIFYAPEGWSPGAGWQSVEVEQENGDTYTAYRYYGKVPPPAFTLPDADHYGKVLFLLVVNDGMKGGAASSDVVDETTGLSIYAANDLRDIAYREGRQFGGHEKWLRDLRHNFRLIGSGVVGGGASIAAPFVLAGADPSGQLSNAKNLSALGSTLAIFSSAAQPISVERSAAAADSVLDVFSLRRTTSAVGHGAAGIGARMVVELENAAGSVPIASRQEWSFLTATNGAEVARHLFRLQAAGSLVDVLDLRGGTVRLPTLAGNGAGVLAIDNDGDVSFSGSAGASATARYLVDAASATNANDVPIQNTPTQLIFQADGFAPIVSSVTDSSDDSALDPVVLRRYADSGNGAAGIGVGLPFRTQDADNNDVDVARIVGTATNASSAGLAGTLSLYVATGGVQASDPAATARASLSGAGLWTTVGAMRSDAGFDRSTAGTALFGTAVATAVTIGAVGITTTIAGNLVVSGTTTTVNSTSVNVADRLVVFNSSTGVVPVPNAIAGFAIDRGSADGVSKRDAAGLFWNETAQRFDVAFNTALDQSTNGTTIPVRAKGLTLTDLGAGVVRSSSGGVLSSSALSSGDVTGALGFTPAAAAITLTAGAGLTGGGDLSADRTFAVAAADASITVNADSIEASGAFVAKNISTTGDLAVTKAGIGETRTRAITATNTTVSGTQNSPQIGWSAVHSGGTQLNAGMQLEPQSASRARVVLYYGTGTGAPSSGGGTYFDSQDPNFGETLVTNSLAAGTSSGNGGGFRFMHADNRGGLDLTSSQHLRLKSYNDKSFILELDGDSGGTGGIERLTITNIGQQTWWMAATAYEQTQWGATADKQYRRSYNARVTTTDGTVTNVTAAGLTPADGSAVAFAARITAYEVATGDRRTWHIRGGAARHGGTTAVDVPNNSSEHTNDGVDTAGWRANVVDVTPALNPQVQGEAGKTIRWGVHITYWVDAT